MRRAAIKFKPNRMYLKFVLPSTKFSHAQLKKRAIGSEMKITTLSP